MKKKIPNFFLLNFHRVRSVMQLNASACTLYAVPHLHLTFRSQTSTMQWQKKKKKCIRTQRVPGSYATFPGRITRVIPTATFAIHNYRSLLSNNNVHAYKLPIIKRWNISKLHSLSRSINKFHDLRIKRKKKTKQIQTQICSNNLSKDYKIVIL